MSFQILVFLIEYDDKNYSRRYLDEIKIQLKDEKNLTLSYQNISLNKYFKKFVLQVVYQFNDYYLQPYLFRPQEIKENMEENIFGTGRNLSFKSISVRYKLNSRGNLIIKINFIYNSNKENPLEKVYKYKNFTFI